MAVKIYKPTSPGRRGRTSASVEEITKAKPERALLGPRHKRGGPVGPCPAPPISRAITGKAADDDLDVDTPET